MNSTTDLWFGGFIILKGYNPSNYELIGRGFSKGKFYFDISDEDWKKLNLEYDKTEHKKMKYAQESLKDLIRNIR